MKLSLMFCVRLSKERAALRLRRRISRKIIRPCERVKVKAATIEQPTRRAATATAMPAMMPMCAVLPSDCHPDVPATEVEPDWSRPAVAPHTPASLECGAELKVPMTALRVPVNCTPPVVCRDSVVGGAVPTGSLAEVDALLDAAGRAFVEVRTRRRVVDERVDIAGGCRARRAGRPLG
jgi:hypothetical protein